MEAFRVAIAIEIGALRLHRDAVGPYIQSVTGYIAPIDIDPEKSRTFRDEVEDGGVMDPHTSSNVRMQLFDFEIVGPPAFDSTDRGRSVDAADRIEGTSALEKPDRVRVIGNRLSLDPRNITILENDVRPASTKLQEIVEPREASPLVEEMMTPGYDQQDLVRNAVGVFDPTQFDPFLGHVPKKAYDFPRDWLVPPNKRQD